MESALHLYMVMLGCKPKNRLTEQHDIFFGIGKSLKDLLPQMETFWPESAGKLHIDAWRKVTVVDGFSIEVIQTEEKDLEQHLFFVNLGGYRPNEFDEYHYKILTVAQSMADAVKKSKQHAFFKSYNFKGAKSHIDDKFGIDVDDIYEVRDILARQSEKYKLRIKPSEKPDDDFHIGYLNFKNV